MEQPCRRPKREFGLSLTCQPDNGDIPPSQIFESGDEEKNLN